MPRSPASRRTPRELSESLLQQLSAYAIAATSAGVGMLALAGSAQAKIVYTPANKRIVNGTILDLNHDHKADFRFGTLVTQTDSGGGTFWSVSPVGSKNRIWGKAASASALSSDVLVGPNKQKFRPGHDFTAKWQAGWWGSSSSGQWRNVSQAYLGLKFFIEGKAHYGWASLNRSAYPAYATLIGYAYETIPNKPILTGKTKGPDATALEPASLGHLSRGASAIPRWRMKKVAATTP